MSAPNALSHQFGDGAQFYDEVRPRYPEAMVEHIVAFEALPAHGPVFGEAIFAGAHTLIHQVFKRRSNATRAYFRIRHQPLF